MSTLTETFQRVLGKKEERRYGVKGEIVFIFKPSLDNPESILDLLRKSIKEADDLFPWREDDVPDGAEKPPSIFYLDDGCVVHPYPGEQHIWFTVQPRYDSMRRGQVYAYEKYLTRLAEELVKPKPWGFWSAEVRSMITIKAATGFKLF